LLIVVPLVVVLLGAVVWWLVGRTLHPVEAIRAEVANIGATELDRRVPTPDTDDEIARLASTMNAMLDRLEDAVRKQQRFVADASHELRSPLTRIRTEVEVALADNGHDDSAAILASVLEETGELQRLVADLLHLARSDAGLTSSKREVVDLDDLVFQEARRLRADGYQVDIDRLSAAQVSGDAYQLTRVVRNLLDNAARHANQLVTIELGEAGGWARLVVSDDGHGVPAADRERIFERFTRLDDARTRDHGGAGLGLAIARDIVDAHGGQLVLTDSGRSTGACFVATIPSNEPRR
ncbi:MAG: ATP-binding protein, partial [Actinomycetota bacterium]